MNILISLIGLLAILITAHGIDRWLFVLHRSAAITLNFTPYLWLASFANLFLAGALILLAWYVNYRANRSLLVSTIFLIIGLGVTFTPVIIFATRSTFLTLNLLKYFQMQYFQPDSHLVFASALVTTIGFAGLILSRMQNNQAL